MLKRLLHDRECRYIHPSLGLTMHPIRLGCLVFYTEQKIGYFCFNLVKRQTVLSIRFDIVQSRLGKVFSQSRCVETLVQ